MTSFDVKSLFISVPLEETINVTLDRIYHRKEIDNQSAKTTYEIYYYCVQSNNVHFYFSAEI